MVAAVPYIQTGVHLAASVFQKTKGVHRLSKLFSSAIVWGNRLKITHQLPVAQQVLAGVTVYKKIYPFFLKPWEISKEWICSSPGKMLWQDHHATSLKFLQTTLKTAKAACKLLETPFVSTIPITRVLATSSYLPYATLFFTGANSAAKLCDLGKRVWNNGYQEVVGEFDFWSDSYEKAKALLTNYSETHQSQLLEEHKKHVDQLKQELHRKLRDLGVQEKSSSSEFNQILSDQQDFFINLQQATSKIEEQERAALKKIQCFQNLSNYCDFLTQIAAENETQIMAMMHFLHYRIEHRQSDLKLTAAQQQLLDLIHRIEEAEYTVIVLMSPDRREEAVSFCSKMREKNLNQIVSAKLDWIQTARHIAQIAFSVIGLATLLCGAPMTHLTILTVSLAADTVGMGEYLWKENHGLCRKKTSKN